MAQVSDRLRNLEGGHFLFWCPGCEQTHSWDGGWKFDGNLQAPTISPSLLVTSGHFIDGHVPGSPCWCTYNRDHPDKPAPFKCYRCHSFIVGGNIQFLGDCTHGLAGQTAPIPPLPDYLRDDWVPPT